MSCSGCIPTFTALQKLRECKLMSRLRSNQPPVSFESDQLTEILSHAQQELAEYNATIARLHETIVSLENEKRNLSRQIQLTKSLMAPIRKIPPELLRQIFIEHGRENFIRPVDSVVPGLKIASVCTHWRAIAFHTTELWNNISVGWEMQQPQWQPSHVSLVKTLLELSKTSLLYVTLDFECSPEDGEIPSCLPLLCKHADRWRSLSGHAGDHPAILNALSALEGRLHNLDSFRLECPLTYCSALVKGASKLHTLAISESISIPLDQIVHLEVRSLQVSQIYAMLTASPNLGTLFVNGFLLRPPAGPERVCHSNLTSLRIVFEHYLELILMGYLLLIVNFPNLDFLVIECCDETQWESDTVVPVYHSLVQQLHSFLPRSSKITTLTLHDISVPTKDLTVFLQKLPSLSSLSLSDPHFSDVSEMKPPSMLNDDLLSMLVLNYQDRQPLLTRLTSLSLEGHSLDSFSMHLFVDVIHSRWKPSFFEDEVACIKTVKLKVRQGLIDPVVVHPLAILEERGLDVVLKHQDGDVWARSRVEG